MFKTTIRDLEILEALTRRVRVLTIAQVARTWWPEAVGLGAARNRVRVLQTAELVQLTQEPAHPELDFEAPVLSWKVGEANPDAGAVSYRLQSRWKQHPVTTVCIAATRSAANLFHGHGGRFSRAVERSHDINLSRVYLIYRQRGAVSGWTFEEEMRRDQRGRNQPLPDVIVDINGKRKIVEFGGAYPKAKLERFHTFCKGHNLPYEIW